MILNQYPIWRYFLLIVVISMGCIYAAPNIYGEDPAVQVSAKRNVIGETELEHVKSILNQEDIKFKSGELQNNLVVIRFNDTDIQFKAQETLADKLGKEYTAALNLVPVTPDWLKSLNALPMYLGLDLRGGIDFLMSVDMDRALDQRLSNDRDAVRSFLRENRLCNKTVIGKNQITVHCKDADLRDKTYPLLQDEFADLTFDKRDTEAPLIIATMRETTVQSERKAALTQNITALRNRVNELGVAEPIIQQQGLDRIVVQLPGVQDSARAKEILGATATLEYRLVYGTQSEWDSAEQTGRIPVNTRLFQHRDGYPVLLQRSTIVTGDNVVHATSGFDQNNLPAVIVTLDGKGADKMSDISGDHIGDPMAVVYIDTKPGTKKRTEEVISIATIQDQLGKRFQTTGLNQAEAQNLALLLRAGALKAPMEIIKERSISASMGQENIKKGLLSVQVGLLLVLIFMIVYYKVFGLIANLALATNMVLLVSILSMLQATLTMPGIAGIVLTIGMAVDANVLIFERIREELRNGNSVQASIHAGYEKAFSTIADANVTTFIAALVLYGAGTGPIKGFAVTLSIGIATSMFTAIMGTRAVVNLIYGSRNVKKLAI